MKKNALSFLRNPWLWAGLLLVLVAAAHSHYRSLQGLLELEEGRSSSVMLVPGPGDQVQEQPLPFTLRLEDFRVERQRQVGTLLCSLAPQAPQEDRAGTPLTCAGAALVVQKEIRALPLKVPALGPDGQEIEVTRFVQTEEGARALLLGRSAQGRTDLVLFPGEPTPLPGTAATFSSSSNRSANALDPSPVPLMLGNA